MALVSEKCATTDERWGDGAVWRGVFPTAGVTPPNCAKAFAAPILTNGFRSLVQSGLKSDVAPCRLCARNGHQASQQIFPLFNHLVGTSQQRSWNIDAQDLRSLEIDEQFKLGRLNLLQFSGHL
jgi:hypothetical protein